jgi:hypothetical protein
MKTPPHDTLTAIPSHCRRSSRAIALVAGFSLALGATPAAVAAESVLFSQPFSEPVANVAGEAVKGS